jgi:hypothetical protein
MAIELQVEMDLRERLHVASFLSDDDASLSDGDKSTTASTTTSEFWDREFQQMQRHFFNLLPVVSRIIGSVLAQRCPYLVVA